MPYIIDGHNLIPKIHGLSLSSTDDEMQLVELLQEYCRLQRKEIEVFFDNAPPGGVRARRFGAVTARFVSEGTTADAAIEKKLHRLGRASRNWTVISSDRSVQAAARAVHASVIPAETFAQMLAQTLDRSKADQGACEDHTISSDDLDEWLQLFGAEDENT